MNYLSKPVIKQLGSIFFILLIGITYTSVATGHSYAVSSEQKRLFNQKSLYYDKDLKNCSAVEASAAGASGKKVIVIDPGHGISGTETDPDTGVIAAEFVGSDGERSAMWSASQIVKQSLEDAGYKVVLTKNSETDPAGLITKAKIANDAKADLAVSLHYTSGTFGTPNGAWGVTPQEVGRFRENKSDGKRKTFTDEAVAAKSKQYAQAIAAERTKTGDKANVAALTGSFPRSRSDIRAWGDISMVQLFATVPWVYNEAGRTGFSAEKYAEGIVNGVKRAVPVSSDETSEENPSAGSAGNSDCSCSSGSSGPVSANGTSDGTLPGFVDAYGQAAFNIGKRYGIPYEAILAQAALESGWGKSDLAAKDNNFFGIKADERWEGETATYSTREDNPPRTIQAAFRKYPTAEDGFTGYASFIHHNERYKEALKYPGDPVRYITELKRAGYATANDYISVNVGVQQDVIAYIRQKNLFPPSSAVQSEGQVPPDQNSANGSGSGSSGSNCGGDSSEGAQSVVEVANREYDKNKGIAEYGGTILQYTDGRQEAWCADFVSWVYKEAGMPFTDGIGNDPKGWQHPGVVNLQTWFKQKQIYFEAGDQKPQPGDVAFYIGAQTPDPTSGEHVNIVVAVNGDTMTTVGGNESQQVTKGQRQIKLGSNNLVGFGRLK